MMAAAESDWSNVYRQLVFYVPAFFRQIAEKPEEIVSGMLGWLLAAPWVPLTIQQHRCGVQSTG